MLAIINILIVFFIILIIYQIFLAHFSNNVIEGLENYKEYDTNDPNNVMILAQQNAGNIEVLRKQFDDWDFSLEGRKRQAERMKTMADEAQLKGIHAVCDFVCPTPETRKLFDADYTIFLDTIDISRYSDTNKVFIKPDADFTINEHLPESAVELIRKRILNERPIGKYNFRKPT